MRGRRIAAVLVAAVGLLVSCSSNDAAPQESSTSVAPSGHGTLAHCLEEHGVPAAPGPVAGPPPGVDQTSWQQAMADCASLAPGPAG